MKLLLAACLTTVCSHAIAGCDNGTMLQPHRMGNFNFETNSWVEHVGTLFRYSTCVANLDPNDLQINWYIPGPNRQWIPAEETLTSPRMLADAVARPLESCVEYGNLPEQKTIAQFMGSNDDEVATNSDTERACKVNSKSAQKAELIPVDIPPDGWKDAVRMFLPSDGKNPKDTMLVLDGDIRIIKGEKGYTTSFEYEIERYKDRPSGDPAGLQMIPFFPDASEYFLAAMKEKYPAAKDPIVKLDSKGEVAFSLVQVSPQWMVSAAYYEFLDKNSEVVGILRIPLFAPVRS